MAKRILFVPFVMPDANNFRDNRGEPGTRPGLSYTSKNNSWIHSYQGKRSSVLDGECHDIYQLWYYPGSMGSPMLRGLGEDDQIYIRGHSVAGMRGIFDNCTLDEKGNRLNVQRILDKSNHLLKVTDENYAGSRARYFILNADEVALRLQEMGLSKGFAGTIKCYNCHSAEGAQNFSQSLTDELYDLGYTACKVYGYTGALSSVYGNAHKESLHEHRTVRASANRVRIYPTAQAASSSGAPGASSPGQ
ncbi:MULTISPECIES: hypothetical protein [unclassified Pseudomonas]|uniref:hypothetical protein n=1 Tax=unclassified Pseudomonas TaxID=196821 RepID=UPI000DA97719|nr:MULTISPECIES: hypothetical protein [unclassified Pseudomonas]MDW3711639.1 hypothetical protein [Pseudomonas sp. 2023EL-01195]PZE09414.1 hypothetical protein DMX10_31230 [Pseudomonas sp. 57B-090624]